jgi:subtilisin family serine protease
MPARRASSPLGAARLLLFFAATAAAVALVVLPRSAAAAPLPPRVSKTEAFDPAFQGWWQEAAEGDGMSAPPSVLAQDGAAAGSGGGGGGGPGRGVFLPSFLVDASVAARRKELLRLTTGFRQQQQQEEQQDQQQEQDQPPPPRVTSAEGPTPPPTISASSSTSSSSTSLRRQRLAAAQWGLDRIDARAPSLDRLYAYNASRLGEGVTIYTIDSGVVAEHEEFACEEDRGEAGAGSAFCSRAEAGPSFLSEGAHGGDDPSTSRDCDGHGTHVASTAVGRRVGVAKRARVVALRVLDCNGTGTIDDVVSALEYVRREAKRPAVVTLSLGVPAGEWSATLERAVRSVVVERGITVVVASGNSDVDACTISPARVPEALTVAATDLEGKFGDAAAMLVIGGARVGGVGGGNALDRVPSSSRRTPPVALLRDSVYAFSNTGPCVDLFAPGVDILAACGGARRCGRVTPDAYAWASGTSMSVPHVAGLAAVFLGAHPDASPEDVRAALVGSATRGQLSGGGQGGEGEGSDAGDGGGAVGGLRSPDAPTRAAGGGGEDGGAAVVLESTPDLQLYTRAVAGAE